MGTPLSDAAVDTLTAVVSAKVEGQRRAGQDAMCAAVAESLVTGEHLLVEAPTGVGKSLAYLVPAVAHALSGGDDGRVVVVTATKALQEQLTNEDLPFLAGALPRFSFAMLKGRSNYLCVAKLDVTQTEGVEGRLDFGPGGPMAALERVAELAEWSEQTSTGDRAEAPGVVTDAVWSQLSVDSGECPGAEHCPVSGRCFAEAARERAATAHIVVVNAHLYAAHLASGGYVLPPHDAVVFDEAHTLEDIFADAFGVRLTPGRIRRVSSRVKGAGGSSSTASALDAAANAIERTLGGIVADAASAPEWGGGPTSTWRDAPSLRTAGARHHEHSAEVRVDPTEGQLAVDLATLSPLAADAMGSLRRLSPTDDRSKVKVAQAQRMAETLAGEVAALLDAEAHANQVAWVAGTAERPELHLATVDVGPALAQALYPGVTAVATSATLAAGGRFDTVAARLGLTLTPPPTDETPSPKPPAFRGLAVDSPFDHKNQGFLYVARHLPEPNDPAFTAAMHDELHRLVTAANGRTLALFTSRAAMERAADALAARGGYEILVQDRLPRPELLARFRSGPGMAIFATQSFWQGVDLPGELCHLVAIDRIPFPRPNEPLHAARREAAERRGANAFASVDLPTAAIRLAQGTGRLIRTTDDRGVVAVFDRRLATKSYRQALLASMPPLRRTIDGGAVCDYLAGLDRDLL